MANVIKTVLTYPLDGSTRDFNIPFEYLARKFVVVTLIGVDRKVLTLNTDYRFATRTTISLTKSWGTADGYTTIELRRVTSTTDRLVDFTDGSILRAYDLNVAQIQTMHVAEEARDLTADTIGVNNDGHLDARGRRVVNVGNAVDRGDAVNLGMLQDWDNSALNQADRSEKEADRAEAAASQADSSAAKALSSEKSASTSATNALASENAAKASQVAAAGSASSSEQSKNEANAYKEAAQTAADTASNHEDKAKEYMERAEAVACSKENPVSEITFTAGGSLGSERAKVRDTVTNRIYYWIGTFPKVIPENSVGEDLIKADGGLWDSLQNPNGKWVDAGNSVPALRTTLGEGVPFKYETYPKDNLNAITERQSNRVRVATWNIWGAGAQGNFGSLGSADRIKALQERWLNQKLDYVGLQECYFNDTFYPFSMYTIGSLHTAFVQTCEPYESGITILDFDYGTGCVSSGADVKMSGGIYKDSIGSSGDKERRAWTRTETTIRGRKYVIYNTHLSYDRARFTQQQSELNNLLLAETNPQVIVMGDFNHEDITLFQPLLDAGWSMGQNKEFNTNNTGGNWHIDNILYKGFSKRVDRGTQDAPSSLSDHKLFYVELEV